MGLLEIFKKKKFESLEEYAYNKNKEKKNNINLDSKLFEFLVHDVFFVTGKGLVVTGKVSLGSIHVNDKVYLEKSNGESKTVIIDGIETYDNRKDSASLGESVGIMLRNVKKTDIFSGNRLYK
jgi:elongation factor Tu